MKKLVTILLLSAVLALVFAQTPEIQIMKIEQTGEGGEDKEIIIKKGTETVSSVYFGIYVEDLSFPKAQELGYEYLYGILITGVVQDSPAWKYRLQEDDIMMDINGKAITDKEEFDKIRKQLRPGDKINVSIWRAGEIIPIEMEMAGRPTEVEIPGVGKPKRLSSGYGGGTYIPLWLILNLDDINGWLTDNNFDSMGENGLLLQGIGGKFPVGKGYFIGGYITSYEDNQKKQDVTDPQYHNYVNYSLNLGGITFDRRIPISNNLISSLGIMVGSGVHDIEYVSSNANYDWNDPNAGDNQNFTMSRSYIAVQPRFEVMYRFLPWLALRAEAGYTYGYAPRAGWRVSELGGVTIPVDNDPDTSFQGINITVGPWFGF